MITESELETMFDETLDSEGTVMVGGYEFYPSRILETLDPTAYRCGMADYADSLMCDGEIVEGYNDEDDADEDNAH